MPTPTTTTHRRLSDLRGPERQVLRLLRRWPLGPEAQAEAWSDLCGHLGPHRARACLSAFETFQSLLSRKSWHAFRLSALDADTLTQDEHDLCRIVMLATEGAREEAMIEATFLVRPDALLPLVCAAERLGLPLLCAECRARLLCRPNVAH